MSSEISALREKTKELQKFHDENILLLKKLNNFLEYHKTFKNHAAGCVFCSQFSMPTPNKCLTGYTITSAVNRAMFELEEEYSKKGATDGALTDKTD